MSPTTQAGLFLIEITFGLYLTALLLRFILQLVSADFYNSISQFIVKITEPTLWPLRKILPKSKKFDAPSLLLALIVQIIELYLILFLISYPSPSIFIIFMWSLTALLGLTIYIFIFTNLIAALASWLASGGYHPILYLLDQINRPLLTPIRRAIPPRGGFDFTPFILFICLYLLQILLIGQLRLLFGVPFFISNIVMGL